MDARKHSDLIYLDGPLTADAILKSIQQRFLEQKNVVRVVSFMIRVRQKRLCTGVAGMPCLETLANRYVHRRIQVIQVAINELGQHLIEYLVTFCTTV